MKYRIHASPWNGDMQCMICSEPFCPYGGCAYIGDHETPVCEVCLAREPGAVAALLRETVADWRADFEAKMAKLDALAADLETVVTQEFWRKIATERGKLWAESEEARTGKRSR